MYGFNELSSSESRIRKSLVILLCYTDIYLFISSVFLLEIMIDDSGVYASYLRYRSRLLEISNNFSYNEDKIISYRASCMRSIRC